MRFLKRLFGVWWRLLPIPLPLIRPATGRLNAVRPIYLAFPRVLRRACRLVTRDCPYGLMAEGLSTTVLPTYLAGDPALALPPWRNCDRLRMAFAITSSVVIYGWNPSYPYGYYPFCK